MTRTLGATNLTAFAHAFARPIDALASCVDAQAFRVHQVLRVVLAGQMRRGVTARNSDPSCPGVGVRF